MEKIPPIEVPTDVKLQLQKTVRRQFERGGRGEASDETIMREVNLLIKSFQGDSQKILKWIETIKKEQDK